MTANDTQAQTPEEILTDLVAFVLDHPDDFKAINAEKKRLGAWIDKYYRGDAGERACALCNGYGAGFVIPSNHKTGKCILDAPSQSSTTVDIDDIQAEFLGVITDAYRKSGGMLDEVAKACAYWSEVKTKQAKQAITDSIQGQTGRISQDTETPKALTNQADNLILPQAFTDEQIMETKDDADEQYMLGFNRCLEDIEELNRSDV